jgi:hypothetical protein
MNKPKPDLAAAMEAARVVLARDPEALTTAGSARHRLELVQIWARIPGERDYLARCALAGDVAAQRACLEIAAEEISRGRALSGALAKFMTGFLTAGTLRTKSRRGRDPTANFSRDFRIALAVFEACAAGRLKATRSPTTKRECGCSVVAELVSKDYGLNITEQAVKKIWDRHCHLR